MGFKPGWERRETAFEPEYLPQQMVHLPVTPAGIKRPSFAGTPSRVHFLPDVPGGSRCARLTGYSLYPLRGFSPHGPILKGIGLQREPHFTNTTASPVVTPIAFAALPPLITTATQPFGVR